MTTHRTGPDSENSATHPTMKRRGMFAAAWAIVAAAVLRKGGEPVAATSGLGGQGALVLGSNGLNSPNSATALTLLQAVDFTVGSDLIQFSALGNGGGNANIVGASGLPRGTAAGLAGIYNLAIPAGYPAGLNAGVYGSTSGSSSRGVFGQNLSNGTAVLGQSQTGVGVQGLIPATSTGNGTAVYGLNYSSYAGPSSGAGGFAVYGLSANGHGLVGATAVPGGAAVVGAINGVAGAYAGVFYGPVVVAGDFTVVGGAKSAALPHPDGTYRRMYCVEAPESWLEDFGTARLECGRADVAIDPDFAAMVDLSDYHVFLSGYDAEDLLHPKRRSPVGFTVEADRTFAALKGRRDSDLTGTFSWRVVAKRKDIAGARLAPVTIPPVPVMPAVPEVPAASS